jgi:hypothetical protein
MIVGAAGLILSLFWMMVYTDRTRERRIAGDRDAEVIHRDVV